MEPISCPWAGISSPTRIGRAGVAGSNRVNAASSLGCRQTSRGRKAPPRSREAMTNRRTQPSTRLRLGCLLVLVTSAGINRGDVVLVYYAGHGVQANGLNYALPLDFSMASDFTRQRGEEPAPTSPPPPPPPVPSTPRPYPRLPT